MTAIREYRNLAIVVTAAVVAIAGVAWGQTPPLQTIGVPTTATSLEGQPDVRVDVREDGVTRRELDAAESARSRLTIQIRDGRLYWQDRPLTVSAAGEFVYLSSAEPGRYVRLRRLNDRLTYVEHVDTGASSVTYWGELRIVLGR